MWSSGEKEESLEDTEVSRKIRWVDEMELGQKEKVVATKPTRYPYEGNLLNLPWIGENVDEHGNPVPLHHKAPSDRN